MLKTLKKIKDGKTDFSNDELALLSRSPSFASYFAKTGQAGVLQQLLDSVRDDRIELFSCFKAAAEEAQERSLRILFQNCTPAQLEDAIDFIEDECFDTTTEPMERVVDSGSINGFRLFADYFENKGGTEYLKETLEIIAPFFQDIPMTDELLYTAHLYGGPELVNSVFQNNSYALNEAFHRRTDKDEDTSDFVRYIVRKAYHYGGEKHLLEELVRTTIVHDDATEFCFYWDRTEPIAAMLDEIRIVFGPKIAKRVLEIEWGGEIYFCNLAAVEGADNVLKVIREIAAENNDPIFTAHIEEIIEEKYRVGRRDHYKKTVDSLIEKIDCGQLSNLNPDEIIKIACRAWLQYEFENRDWDTLKWDQEDIDGFRALADYEALSIRDQTMREMVIIDDWQSLELLINLMEKTIGVSAVFEVTRYFELALYEYPQVTRELGEYILHHAGSHYVQTILSTDHPSTTDILPLPKAIDGNKTEMVKVILDLAMKAGGTEFVCHQLSRHNYRSIKTAEENDNFELVKYMLDMLTDDHRKIVFENMPEYWQEFYDGKIGRNRFWQQLGNGRIRWEEITGDDAPHKTLRDQSPYRFKPQLYAELLPLIELYGQIHYMQKTVTNAYKLSVLFSNFEEVDRYLTKYFRDWMQEGRESQALDDACDFEIPNHFMWTPNKWKPLILKYGPAASKYLAAAPRIERHVGDKPFPQSLKQLRAVAMEAQFIRAGEHPEFAKLAVAHWSHKDLSQLAGRHGLTVEDLNQQRFNTGLEIIQEHGKTRDQLPHIFIDGANIDHPDFYMTRLKPDDPVGLILGDITSDCQTIMNNGHHCMVHGMTSEYGGFYVWKQKTKGQVTKDDKIVAQSWAWVGQDYSLVFDTFERKRSIHARLCQPFLEQFAHEVAGNYKVNGQITEGPILGVRLGTDGYTPPLFIPKATNPSEPIDYDGKTFLWDDNGRGGRESQVQYEIMPIDHANIKRINLAPPSHEIETEIEALRYISKTTKRIEEQFGIIIKTGLELECYAIDNNGKPNSQILSIEDVQDDLHKIRSNIRFENENDDGQGQYEAITETSDPLDTVNLGEQIRKHLTDNATKYGIQAFDFFPLPFDDREASSLHISLSLWSQKDEPLFAGQSGEIFPITSAIAKGILEVQRYTTLLSAQNDLAYARFGYSEWSPAGICLNTRGWDGGSLRIANKNAQSYLSKECNPSSVRLENRLPASDSNIAIAMAGLIAGVDNALNKYVRFFDKEDPIMQSFINENGYNDNVFKGILNTFSESDRETYSKDDIHIVHNGQAMWAVAKAQEMLPPQPLPKSRFEAILELHEGIADDVLGLNKDIGPLIAALLKQHQFGNDLDMKGVAETMSMMFPTHLREDRPDVGFD